MPEDLIGASMPSFTKYLHKGSSKTFGGSFEKEGAVKAGETLSEPSVVITSGSGVVVIGEAINATEFLDSEDGDPIPAGKGAIARFDASNAVPGTYQVEWTVKTSGGDTLKLSGRLIITDPVA